MSLALWVAQGFAALVLGAIRTHRRLHESFVPALVLVLICFAIAAGRFSFGT